MALVKCPRCELNYILDGGDLCTVCRKEVRGGSEQDDIAELCSECGENSAVPGGELCLSCLKEKKRQVELENASPLPTDDEFDDEDLLEDDEDLDEEEE